MGLCPRHLDIALAEDKSWHTVRAEEMDTMAAAEDLALQPAMAWLPQEVEAEADM